MHFYYDIDQWELYDLENDAIETNNVYNEPEFQEIVTEMKIKLKQTREKYKDSEALSNQYINLYKEKGYIE